MRLGARPVALIMAGILAVGMTACPNHKASQKSQNVPTGLGDFSLVKPPVGPADPTVLRRPLRLPQIAAGQRCPLTKGTNTSAGYKLGAGPVHLILDAARDARGVYHYGPSALYNRFRLIAARWIIESDAKGAIFLHGARLDAHQGVWFLPTVGSRNMYRTTAVGELPAIEIYRWLLLPAQNTTHGQAELDGGTATRGSGCFGIQVDGPSFTSVIVFSLER